jgi:ribose/xylose/arabinose/galactoside ABC-type transport system permease subunit
MRRLSWTILIFLSLGAVLTVALAFAFSCLEIRKNADPQLTAALRRSKWIDQDAQPEPSTDVQWLHSTYSASGSDIIVYGQRRDMYQVHRAGWPCRAMMGVVDGDVIRGTRMPCAFTTHGAASLGTPVELYVQIPTGGKPLPVFARSAVVLPLRPLWPGFALSTVFWAVLLWLLWMLPRGARSVVWFVRRRCVHCGYPIGVSPVCTECGRLIRIRRQRGASSGGAAKLGA